MTRTILALLTPGNLPVLLVVSYRNRGAVLIPTRLFGMALPVALSSNSEWHVRQRMATRCQFVRGCLEKEILSEIRALVVLTWLCRYLVYKVCYCALRDIVTDTAGNISLLLSASPPTVSHPYCTQIQLPFHPSVSPSHALLPLPWSCTPIHPD